jgi:hypothetical protein
MGAGPVRHDYSEHLDGPDEKDVALLRRLAHAQLLAEKELEVAEERLKAAREKLRDIAERQVPEVLDRMGVSKLTTSDGHVVSISDDLRVHTSEERREPSCDWLEAQGQSGIIRRSFNIRFTKEDEAWARQFEAQLARRKRPLDVVKKREVHPSTLKKVLKELLAAKVEVPLELFGAQRLRVSKVERRKQ